MVEGALGHPGGLHDFLHAGAVIAATGHHLGAFGEDQVTFVESLVGVHAGKDMTGRLASPSTIDSGDGELQGCKLLSVWPPSHRQGFFAFALNLQLVA
ncbi:hypothetical protein D3C71_1948560 [compost metagenome]